MLTAELAPAHLDAPADFAELRRGEFARLDSGGHAYLDYTGSALYPESLVIGHQQQLRSGVFGNPHADSPASITSTHMIEGARQRVLDYLDADAADYAVCFTANATAALGLVGSAFPFEGSSLLLAADNHNSVNGIREFARRAGAAVQYLPLDDTLRLDDAHVRLTSLARGARGGLFAFPAQSNFSGVRHPLSLVSHAQSLGFRVLLDAAAYLPTSRLSLRNTPADFVALSFYKMFGYPTGVGALIARRAALGELRRPWFSGGTIAYVSIQNDMHGFRPGEEAFEDGTSNFLGISAISSGLEFLESVGVERIEHHAMRLADALMRELTTRSHANGAPLAVVYGPLSGDRGATVAFNILSHDGAFIPFAQVEARARDARVSIRGGCFCNPGASEKAFGFPADAAARCLKSVPANAWSIDRFSACLGNYAVGALRASFGAPSNESDLERLVAVVDSFTSD